MIFAGYYGMLHRGDDHILDDSNCNIVKFLQVIMVCYTGAMIIFLMIPLRLLGWK